MVLCRKGIIIEPSDSKWIDRFIQGYKKVIADKKISWEITNKFFWILRDRESYGMHDP